MIRIIGAGMAGLLAGAMFRQEGQIYEAAEALPNNHHALLRFKHDEIARHLNIPFKPVDVMKIVKPHRNRVAETISYSLKAGGRAAARSSVTANGELERRFIAPMDFIQQLADHQRNPIQFGTVVDRAWIESHMNEAPIISTMPMSVLMQVLGYEHRASFGYRHGWVIAGEVDIESDMCATIYYPAPGYPVTRATLTGSTFQIEMVENYDPMAYAIDRIVEEVMYDFGLEKLSYSAELKAQKYAKILPLPDRERKRFILWATDQFNVYSLGRFAVWKPGLLLDHVFHDVQAIMGMIRNGTNYEGRLK